jgi:hypothetical protein
MRQYRSHETSTRLGRRDKVTTPPGSAASIARRNSLPVKQPSHDAASVAPNSLPERASGKLKEFDPREVPTGGMRIDVLMLTSDQRALLLPIIQSGAVKPH